MSILTIKKRSDFISSNKQAEKIHGRSFVIQKLKRNELNVEPHFGFTATKKIGTAVVRNKIKRRLKSIIRNLLNNKNEYFDLSVNYILICKKEIVKVSYKDLQTEIKAKFIIIKTS
tara:strand:- start:258 stop:605 length:348 start_codon:yes stop_codon:yes gene_type:complete